jgi:alanine racemase
MSKVLETTLEIDLRALTHNFNFLKSKLHSNTKFLAVVKAFAYGSDAVEVAKHLQQLGADYLAVAYVKEGVALRDAGVTLPILVLHPQPVNFKTLIDRCLEPSLYSFKVLNEFIEVSKNLNQNNYPVHIKINTGLNRLGFKKEDIETISDKTITNNSIKIKSVFSHLAASEDLNESEFTFNQINQFKLIAKQLSELIGYQPWLHICNTSGVLNYPDAHFDMVRCGISLYGFGNDPKYDQHLKPIASLKSVISQIHHIKKGASIGYNRALVAENDMRTATIPIGHADGLSRIYGKGKGFVYINNQKAPIAGNVCMDMIMVDITNVDCQEGDEVIVFNNKYSANDLASSAGTISYELLTAISQRVSRKYIK